MDDKLQVTNAVEKEKEKKESNTNQDNQNNEEEKALEKPKKDINDDTNCKNTVIQKNDSKDSISNEQENSSKTHTNKDNFNLSPTSTRKLMLINKSSIGEQIKKLIKDKNYDIIFNSLFFKSENKFLGLINEKNFTYIITLNEYLLDDETKLNEIKLIISSLIEISKLYPDVLCIITQHNYAKKIYQFIINQYINKILLLDNESIDNEYKNLLLNFLEVLIHIVDVPIETYELAYSFLSSQYKTEDGSLINNLNEQKMLIYLDLLKILYGKETLEHIKTLKTKFPKNYIIHNGKGDIQINTLNYKNFPLRYISITFWFYIKNSGNDFEDKNILGCLEPANTIIFEMNGMYEGLQKSYIRIGINNKYTKISLKFENASTIEYDVIKQNWYCINLEFENLNRVIKFNMKNCTDLLKKTITDGFEIATKINMTDIRNLIFFRNFYGLSTSIIILNKVSDKANNMTDISEWFHNFNVNKLISQNKFRYGIVNYSKYKNLITLATKNNINLVSFYSPLYSYNSTSFNEECIVLADIINCLNGKMIDYQKKGLAAYKTKKNAFYRNFPHTTDEKYKHINLIGGANSILPIIELIFTHKKILLSKKIFKEYIDLVSIVTSKSKYNFYNASTTYFFNSLSIFLERIPKDFYNQEVTQLLVQIIVVYAGYYNFFYKISKPNDEYIKLNDSFIKSIYLNQKIFMKFTDDSKKMIFNDISKRVINVNVNTGNNEKINEKFKNLALFNAKQLSLLLRKIDKERYTKYCCKKHKQIFVFNEDEGKTDDDICYPSIDSILNSIIPLINNILLYDSTENIMQFFGLLCLDISPCMTLFIIERGIKLFRGIKSDRMKEDNSYDESMKILFKNGLAEIIINSLNTVYYDIKAKIIELIMIIISQSSPTDNPFSNFIHIIKKNILLPSKNFSEIINKDGPNKNNIYVNQHLSKAEETNDSTKTESITICDDYLKFIELYKDKNRKPYININNLILLKSDGKEKYNIFEFIDESQYNKDYLLMYNNTINVLEEIIINERTTQNALDILLNLLIFIVIKSNKIFLLKKLIIQFQTWIDKEVLCLIISNNILFFIMDTFMQYSSISIEEFDKLKNESATFTGLIENEKDLNKNEICDSCNKLLIKLFESLLNDNVTQSDYENMVYNLFTWIINKNTIYNEVYKDNKEILERLNEYVDKIVLQGILNKYKEKLEQINQNTNLNNEDFAEMRDNLFMHSKKISYFLNLYLFYVLFSYKYVDILSKPTIITNIESNYNDFVPNFMSINSRIKEDGASYSTSLKNIIEIFNSITNLEVYLDNINLSIQNINLIKSIDEIINKYILQKDTSKVYYLYQTDILIYPLKYTETDDDIYSKTDIYYSQKNLGSSKNLNVIDKNQQEASVKTENNNIDNTLIGTSKKQKSSKMISSSLKEIDINKLMIKYSEHKNYTFTYPFVKLVCFSYILLIYSEPDKEIYVNNFTKLLCYIIILNANENLNNYSNKKKKERDEETIKNMNHFTSDLIIYSLQFLVKMYLKNRNLLTNKEKIFQNNLNILFYLSTKILSSVKAGSFILKELFHANSISNSSVFKTFNKYLLINKKNILISLPKLQKDIDIEKYLNNFTIIYDDEKRKDFWENNIVKKRDINFFHEKNILLNIFKLFSDLKKIIPVYDLNVNLNQISANCKIIDLFKLNIISEGLYEIKDVNTSKIICKITNQIISTMELFEILIKKSRENRIKKINKYRKIKEKLFSWNSLWSDKELFYSNKLLNENLENSLNNSLGNFNEINESLYEYDSENPNRLKQKVMNHYSLEFSRPLLKVILDIDYYLPNFEKINKEELFLRNTKKNKVMSEIKLFNNEKYANMKYKFNLDINDILEAKIDKKELLTEENKENEDVDKNKINATTNKKYNKVYQTYCHSEYISYYQNYSKNFKFQKEDNLKEMQTIEITENSTTFPCCLVKQGTHIKGALVYKKEKSKIIFISNDHLKYFSNDKQKMRESEIQINPETNMCYGSLFSSQNRHSLMLKKSINIEDILYLFKRKYYYNTNSFEIFTVKNQSYFFNFHSQNERDILYNKLFKTSKMFSVIKIKDNEKAKGIGFYNTSVKLPNRFSSFNDISSLWEQYSMSSFEFLMWCNILSNRSYSEINQYPVFPWTLLDYNSEKLSLKEKKVFRDFKAPVGMQVIESIPQNNERRNQFIELYKDMVIGYQKNRTSSLDEEGPESEEYSESVNDMNESANNSRSDINNTSLRKEKFIDNDKIPYVYGTHYSNPINISHFLSRIFPYTQIRLELQGGNTLDDDKRLFNSVEESFISAMSHNSDVRELIPEFFYLPEMFNNINNIRISNLKDVDLPQYAKNKPYEFIRKCRKSLEHKNADLNSWIDIIFGHKQIGEESEKIYNVFQYTTYDRKIQITKCKNDYYIKSYMMLNEFGMTPIQITNKKIPERRIENLPIQITSKNMKYEVKPVFTGDKTIAYITYHINIIEDHGVSALMICNDFSIMSFALPFSKDYFRRYEMHFKDYELYNLCICLPILSVKSNSNPIISYNLNSPSNNLKNDANANLIFSNTDMLYIIGGFYNGILFSLEYKNDYTFTSKIIRNELDTSPVTSIVVDNLKRYGICGTKKGNVNVYKITNYREWEFSFILDNMGQEIITIVFNDILQVFCVGCKKGYANIYTFPTFKLIRSIKLTEVNISKAYLSSTPVPCVSFYIGDKNAFLVFTINGSLISSSFKDSKNRPPGSLGSDNDRILSSCMFRDIFKNDYLVIGTEKGNVKILKFPSMGVKKIIKIGFPVLDVLVNSKGNTIYAWGGIINGMKCIKSVSLDNNINNIDENL